MKMQKKAVIGQLAALLPGIGDLSNAAGPAWDTAIDHARLLAKMYHGYDGTAPKTWLPAAKSLIRSAVDKIPRLPSVSTVVQTGRSMRFAGAARSILPHPATFLRTH